MNQWNAQLYDSKHQFVSNYGESLLKVLDAQPGEHILDVGCGTGDLTQTIADAGAAVTGIDASADMIQKAKSKYPALSFDVADAQQLSYENAFDAAFSNAALHWMRSPQNVLTGVFDSLVPGGRFVAEFGGKGNVQTITKALFEQCAAHGHAEARSPWYFPSIGEYSHLMELIGFDVHFAHLYDRPTPLQGDEGLKSWLHMFADGILASIDSPTVDAILNATEEQLRPTLFQNGEWVADYRRLRVVAFKPNH
ncbi:class I SAM-dependent methyltransferase [Aureibacillus halotolerans]|uniref:Trans-aconitate methyltransferase n=1 Tax=Aureibacillus halotolerans TaxID=1508390 RepID=A0A4R6TT81_9BACI|nr:class I SAM-dependent methyltransferase [Aureibacillus halotolerans]TDQ34114.1 trans-aconitate methyltransferase [Aureibacillus halotolerans]